MSGFPLPQVSDDLVRSGSPAPDDLPQRHSWPVPWVNGPHGEKGDFYSFRDDVSLAESERLCCICGDPLRALVAIAALSGGDETSGGWGHPRCVLLAVKVCPHFAAIEGTVAWIHEGEGLGILSPATFEIDSVDVETSRPIERDELREIARSNPWGDPS